MVFRYIYARTVKRFQEGTPGEIYAMRENGMGLVFLAPLDCCVNCTLHLWTGAYAAED